jgi:drug/metabolite transporter (DMT)-like permease
MTAEAETETDETPLQPRWSLAGVWRSAWPLLLIANLFWAGNIIVGRVIVSNVPVVTLSLLRWTGAFAVCIWFAWPHLKKDRPLLLKHWKLMLLLAATGIAFFNTAAYIGLAGTTALNVLLMQSALPLVVTICGFLLFGERPTLWQSVAVLISMAGVGVVAAHGSLEALLSLRFVTADLWVMASVLIYGVYIVALRGRPDIHPLSFMATMSALGVVMVAPFAAWEFSLGARVAPLWSAWAGIACMAIFPSFVSYLFFNRAVTLMGSARAGHSTHLIPIFGTIMAVLFLGERFHAYHLAAVILIGGGIVLAQSTAQTARAATQSSAPTRPVGRLTGRVRA